VKLNPIVLALFVLAAISSPAADHKTQNVFLIMSDGLRWQEVFRGAEEPLINKSNGGVANVDATRKAFWRDTPEQRREALMPFLWTEIAKRGQIFGNTNKGSISHVTNGKKFSYPGYNEVITGAPDDRINSNDKFPNPNTNVFEWLNERPAFRNKVAVVGDWNVFPYIFNDERSALPIWPAWEKTKFGKNEIQTTPELNQLFEDTTAAMGPDVTFDSFIYQAAAAHIQSKKPRFMFVGFGETDEWAHSGRYDFYLSSANKADAYIARLWDLVQSIPQYKNKTTFVITCDHGRGSGPNWKHHGPSIEGAEYTWIAVLGPDTAPLGERTNRQPITHNQIAATLAALVGENYNAAFPKTGAPIADVLSNK
jgi:hypothetical protein